MYLHGMAMCCITKSMDALAHAAEIKYMHTKRWYLLCRLHVRT